MRLTVLGGDGGWPRPGGACSGYLLEHDGAVVLVDPGYGVLPRVLELVPATAVTSVLVSHGHPDHCADLHPLLRARAFGATPAPPLPVYAPRGALDAVLALDRPGVVDDAVAVTVLEDGDRCPIGPFTVATRLLPHTWPNLGMRIEAAGRVLAYTGDAGPSDVMVDLATGADVLLAEASHVDAVPADMAGLLSTAVDAGRLAVRAGVRRLVLCHLLPDSDVVAAERRASAGYPGPVDVARPGLVVELG